MMEKKKVTSEALRKMEIGQTVTFELPDADAINSGKAIAYRLQNSLRCKFSAVSDYVNNRLALTKKRPAMTQDELDKLVLAIGRNVLLAQKEVLTLEEVARYTGLKKSYLYKLTAAKAIPHYKPNGKNCFFKRTELEEWLTTNPVATTADLTAAAQAYCMTKKPTL